MRSNGKTNNHAPDPPRSTRLDRGGNFSPESVEWMERRAEEFRQMTGGKGKPMTYGAGKK